MKWEHLPGAPLLLLGTKWQEDEWGTKLTLATAFYPVVICSLKSEDISGASYKSSHCLFDLAPWLAFVVFAEDKEFLSRFFV